MTLRSFRPQFFRSWGAVGTVVLCLLVFAVGAPAPTYAQSDDTELERFQTADSLVRAGKFEQAIKLLEELYAESPRNTTFYQKLKEAYESVKRYDDALQLVEDRVGSSPTPALLSEKARLQYQKGSTDAANQTLDRALTLAPNRARTYQTVYKTLVDTRRFKKAIEVLQQGRDALDRPAAFRTELASLYGLDGQHKKAMQEYVSLLADDPQRVSFVRSRLQTFVEQGKGIEASIEVLRKAVRESPLNGTYRRLLSWLYMEQRNYEAAFKVYRALDRLAEQQGRELLRFSQKAVDAREYRVATDAFRAILDRYPESEVAPKARRALGNAYRQWAQSADTPPAKDSSRYDNAKTAYRTFLETYPDHSEYPQVLLQLSTLQLDVFRALTQAKSTLDQLVKNYSDTPAAAKGQYHLARIALFQDRLNRARLLFSRLAEDAQDSDLADRARYELALLNFYQGGFDSALARVKAISETPAADVANDAIQLKVLLQENQGPDSLDTPLRTFSRVRLYDRQHRHKKALATLDTLLQSYPRHSLADNARFRRAKLHLARRDTSAALKTFRELPKRHPRSPFADRSLFRIGALLQSQGQDAKAVEAYNRLLADYPNSLHAGDVRSRLRTLMRTQG